MDPQTTSADHQLRHRAPHLFLPWVVRHRAGSPPAEETIRYDHAPGIFGASFFLLIGTHGLHAAAAALITVYVYMRLTRHRLGPGHLRAAQVFRYFVVRIRRILCGLV